MIVITLLAVVVVGVKFAIFNIDVRCLNENLRTFFSKKDSGIYYQLNIQTTSSNGNIAKKTNWFWLHPLSRVWLVFLHRCLGIVVIRQGLFKVLETMITNNKVPLVSMEVLAPCLRTLLTGSLFPSWYKRKIISRMYLQCLTSIQYTSIFWLFACQFIVTLFCPWIYVYLTFADLFDTQKKKKCFSLTYSKVYCIVLLMICFYDINLIWFSFV